jgi:hypothetical protein
MIIKFNEEEKRIEFTGFNNFDSVIVEGNEIPLSDGIGFWTNQNQIKIGDKIKIQLTVKNEIVREIEIEVKESIEF